MQKTKIHKKEENAKEPFKKEILSYSYEGPLKKSVDIATFYGFKVIPPPETKASSKKSYKDDDFFTPIEEKEILLNRFFNNEFGNAGFPAMLCYTKRSPVKRSTYLHLEVIGSFKSMADALILSASIAISKDHFGKNICVIANNIGEKESLNAYIREITSYYKKNLGVLDAKCRQNFKKDVFKIFECQSEKCLDLEAEAPKSLSYIGETLREHFKEVIEFLENMDIVYEIENMPISNIDYANKTLFEIRKYQKEEDIGNSTGFEVLARGSRYDGLSKKMGLKKNIGAMSVSIKFDNVPQKESYKLKSSEKSKAKVFLIQFGASAKQKILKMIEVFRASKISISHALMRDDLGSQLSMAEKSGTPFIAILGQKEIVENSIMIRNMTNRSQDSINIDKVGTFLKEELKKLE